MLVKAARVSVYSIARGWERDQFASKITNFPIKVYVEKCLRDGKMKFQHCFPRSKKRLVPSWKKTFSPPVKSLPTSMLKQNLNFVLTDILIVWL